MQIINGLKRLLFDYKLYSTYGNLAYTVQVRDKGLVLLSIYRRSVIDWFSKEAVLGVLSRDVISTHSSVGYEVFRTTNKPGYIQIGCCYIRLKDLYRIQKQMSKK